MTANTLTKEQALTDANLSCHAAEFVWTGAGLSPAHAYLLPTVLGWLREAGARAVLDLGCGNGAVTGALARQGFAMTGLDASQSGIALASRSFPSLPFARADLGGPLPEELQGAFDAVISIEVIEHLLLPRLLFERAREALRPGGVLLVTTPYHGYLKNLALALTNRFDHHWHPLRDYGHVKFFSPRTLGLLFMEQGWSIQRFSRVGRVPPLAKSMIVQAAIATEGRIMPLARS